MNKYLYLKQKNHEKDNVKYPPLLPYAYIEFNTSISNPANITASKDRSILDVILSKFRRCLCKKTNEGKVAIAYLDDSNSNFYEDGSPAILTGGEGDVMVYFPEFWYKGETTSKGYRFNFALEQIDSTWKHAPASLVGAYKAYIYLEKLYSRSNVESTGNKTMAEFGSCARARGAGYHIIDYQQHCIIAWMFYAKYLTRNSQAVCGTGKGDYTGLKCGSTNTLGITDTTATNATSNSSLHVNFLGIEGCWGYKCEWIEGIHTHYKDNKVNVYDKGDYHNQAFSNIVSPTKRQFDTFNSGNYIKKIQAGEYMDMLASNILGGLSSTYFCDYGGSFSSSSYIFYRSCERDSTYGGVSYLVGSKPSASATYDYVGSRLAFDGTITVASSVSVFKSLDVL